MQKKIIKQLSYLTALQQQCMCCFQIHNGRTVKSEKWLPWKFDHLRITWMQQYSDSLEVMSLPLLFASLQKTKQPVSWEDTCRQWQDLMKIRIKNWFSFFFFGKIVILMTVTFPIIKCDTKTSSLNTILQGHLSLLPWCLYHFPIAPPIMIIFTFISAVHLSNEILNMRKTFLNSLCNALI